MKKYHLYYDWNLYSSSGNICEAHLEMGDKIYLIESAPTFEEAKLKVIARGKALPPDEEVEF